MATPHLAITPELRRLLLAWLMEDLGRGDLTAPALKDQWGNAFWMAKAPGVFCGGVLLAPLLSALDPGGDHVVRLLVNEGQSIAAGDRLLELEGSAHVLVAMERTALNLAMRLSGIATATAALVMQLQGTGVHLVDTRKTTPGLRCLEKYAVRCGGGRNHRMALDDAAMLKENHLAWAGGVAAAVAAVRQEAPWPTQVIVEAETAVEARAAVMAGADGVLLDEFSPSDLTLLVDELRQMAKARPGATPVILEASGVDPAELKAYAATGIDLISTSAPVTRSSWLDLSMRFTPAEG